MIAKRKDMANATLLALYFVPAAYILLMCRGRGAQLVVANRNGKLRTVQPFLLPALCPKRRGPAWVPDRQPELMH